MPPCQHFYLYYSVLFPYLYLHTFASIYLCLSICPSPCRYIWHFLLLFCHFLHTYMHAARETGTDTDRCVYSGIRIRTKNTKTEYQFKLITYQINKCALCRAIYTDSVHNFRQFIWIIQTEIFEITLNKSNIRILIWLKRVHLYSINLLFLRCQR